MKKIKGLLLALGLSVLLITPVYACTPQYDYSNIWGDLTPPSEIEYKPSEEIDKICENAAKKWLEEHPIDIKIKETETETEMETETEQKETYREMYKSHWYNMFRFWR